MLMKDQFFKVEFVQIEDCSITPQDTFYANFFSIHVKQMDL